MGLDVTAYGKVTLVEALPLTEHNAHTEHPLDAQWETHAYLYTVGFDRADGLVDGFYLTERKLRVGHWTYSGYNRWRDELAALVGTTAAAVWKDPKPGPFVELINFSDCDGFIGPKTCAKLARDFGAYHERVGDAGDFAEGYESFAGAFRHAADSGAVRFG